VVRELFRYRFRFLSQFAHGVSPPPVVFQWEAYDGWCLTVLKIPQPQ